jgi:hypothetical protein
MAAACNHSIMALELRPLSSQLAFACISEKITHNNLDGGPYDAAKPRRDAGRPDNSFQVAAGIKKGLHFRPLRDSRAYAGNPIACCLWTGWPH